MGRARREPELAVAQAKKKGSEAGSKKKKAAGWSTNMLEEVVNKQEFEDTEGMVQWRRTSQEGANDLELCEQMETSS